ncbi:hypothetical protein [Streptomyces sp. SID3343]|nr:hypothetical protein [Streptomyces sp. SID3343]MYW04504.1 hypothetical protein [Streptomyces sp. SID3343]
MAKCTNCKGKGSVRMAAKETMPGSVRNLRRNERTRSCPDCLGTGRTR